MPIDPSLVNVDLQGRNDAGRNENWKTSGMLVPLGEKNQSRRLLAIRDPDVLYLGGMFEEPATFGDLGIKPVDGFSFVGPDLLQVSDGHCFCAGHGGVVAIDPDAIDVVV